MKHKLAVGALVVLAASLVTTGGLLAQKAQAVRQDVQIVTSGDSGWLGVRLEDVTAQKARDLKLPGEFGALVTEVESQSPASKAGIQVNDVLVDFAGDKVRSVAEIRRLIRETPAGREVPVEIVRNGDRRSLRVTLQTRPEGSGEYHGLSMPPMEIRPEIRIPPHAFEFPMDRFWNRRDGVRLGIRGQDLTPQLADYFGVKQGKGALVAEVEKGSPAEKAGLRAGDCIVRVDSRDVASVEDLHDALTNGFPPESNQWETTLTIVRDHHEQTLKAELVRPSGETRYQSFDDRTLDYEPEELDLEALQGEIAALQRELREPSAKLQEQLRAAAKAQADALHAQVDQVEELSRQLQDRNSQLRKEMQQYKKQMLPQKELLKQLRRQLNGLDIV
jgi:C-terminal processing protease CtpA/Prc